MSIITKTYHFASNVEGWVANKAHANITMRWWMDRVAKKSLTAPLSNWGGSLHTVTQRNNSGGENYWSLSTTWENLGVTPGDKVYRVKLDYLYRFSVRDRWGSVASFASNALASGPVKIYDSTGETEIGTFSEAIYAPSRTASANDWNTYPNSLKYPYSTTYLTDYPLNDIPPSWGIALGSYVDVGVAYRASDTTVLFKLYNLLPDSPNYGKSSVSGTQYPATHVSVKQDKVVITMDTTDVSIIGLNTIQGISAMVA